MPSRLLQHAPGLPRVELIVGCLQHLFYMTNQLKQETGENIGPAAGKQIPSPPFHVHSCFYSLRLILLKSEKRPWGSVAESPQREQCREWQSWKGMGKWHSIVLSALVFSLWALQIWHGGRVLKLLHGGSEKWDVTSPFCSITQVISSYSPCQLLASLSKLNRER